MNRRGIETKIISGAQQAAPDKTLIELLGKAHHWLDEIRAGKFMHQISSEEGRNEDYVRLRIELAFLSPKLQQQILEGTQPPHLTLAHLTKGRIPLDWQDQEKLFT